MTFGVSSSVPFLFLNWTASGGVLYALGACTININGDGADELASSPVAPLANGDGFYTFTVPAVLVGRQHRLRLGRHHRHRHVHGAEHRWHHVA